MIRTVLGDIDPTTLGPTNYHEHLFQVSPLLRGDELIGVFDLDSPRVDRFDAADQTGLEAIARVFVESLR